ncbi:hypothetical protein BJV82DRAFT_664038 [Fennellomyces sp. T-0311]|nr:hypothetical protein BJV82DRAFT_664038 [Fennellomyces sp. T-0311]
MSDTPSRENDSASDKVAELVLAILCIERTQEALMGLLENQIATLNGSLQDQTAVNTRLLNLLERNEASSSTSVSAAATTLNSVMQYIKHPRKMTWVPQNQALKLRRMKFSWPVYVEMIKNHRTHQNLPALSEEEIESRIEHVKKIYLSVILYFKTTYQLGNTLKWLHPLVKVHHHTMCIKLEEEASAYIPLNFCVGSWGPTR